VTLTKGQPSLPKLDGQHEMCEENIQHLFFDCHYAKFLWRTLQFTFNIQSPMSINDMFTNWLLALGCKHRRQILVGASALCWSI
jgi:hypothetical protein